MPKSASFAKHRMRENRNNQFRPEQQEICTFLRRKFPQYTTLMEERITYKKENGSNGLAIVDILIQEIGVVFRLNGGIHHSNTQELKDWEQKEYLEQLGYMVIDVEM